MVHYNTEYTDQSSINGHLWRIRNVKTVLKVVTVGRIFSQLNH